MTKDVAVLAGTGKSGRRVAAALRVAGHRVRVAGRRGPVRFDWRDPATWPSVVDGADAAYLVVSDTDPDQVAPFVATAVAAGVQRLVMLSGRSIEHLGGGVGDALVAGEEAVVATGLGTILRVSNFAQSFTEDWHAPSIRAGRVTAPAANVGDSFVDLGDVAAVTTRVLGEPGHEGRTYELTGPETLTFDRAIDVVAAATGRDVRFEPLDPEAYATELRAAGTDEFGVRSFLAMFALMRDGRYEGLSNDIPYLLGRPARAFEEWAVEQASLGAWG